MTTDLKPKLAMEECEIGNKKVKIYGIAKGSGMIFPNMATTLGYVFTDADLSSMIFYKSCLKKILKQHLMQLVVMEIQALMIWFQHFQQAKLKIQIIENINDKKI